MIRLLVIVVVAGLSCGLLGAVAGPKGVAVGALAVLVNWVAFVPAYLRRSERFYDLVGSLTYGLVTGVALGIGQPGWRGMVAALCVGVWAVRLGSFLVRRIARDGKDGRFDEIKQSAPRFLGAWTLQATWVMLTLAAALGLILGGSEPQLALTDLGFGLWALGFGIEVVADRQKQAFRARGTGRWIDEGLWSWCQHPNYLGEIVLWTGVFVVAAGHLRGWGWLAAISPLFVTLLLTRVSGIPMLRERGQARWGDDVDYQDYLDRTPTLIPRPPRARG
jgi:steroid 5-alpha reductase family enzyme